jgi:hypothetical protein
VALAGGRERERARERCRREVPGGEKKRTRAEAASVDQLAGCLLQG